MIRGNVVHLYKTQNITFDQFCDQISVKSLDQIVTLLDSSVTTDAASPVNAGSVSKSLSAERQSQGFSVVNGVLIMHGKVKQLVHRKTIFLRLETPIRVNCGGEHSVDLIACTLSPAKFGALSLRYLARFTRLFHNDRLVENLRAVNSVDGIEVLLSSDRDIAA
jgi:mannitol/fructose-specific phosphotransferase system IIA component (Ntr-type)